MIHLARNPASVWEAAYLRFQTREQEVRRSLRRLRRMGADRWPRNARVAELFCGSGGGLEALERIGFSDVVGVDRSPSLLAEYRGPFECVASDCRELDAIGNGSKDLLIVQGGLHHLERLRDDLPRMLREAWRVLSTNGLLAVIEPWSTPFLSFAHAVCGSAWARRASRKVDALAAMIEQEGETYRTWLASPAFILESLDERFETTWSRVAWGKRLSVSRRRPIPIEGGR